MIVPPKHQDSFSNEHRKIIKILIPLFLVIALPFVLLAARQQTEDRHYASEFRDLNTAASIGQANNPDGTMGPVDIRGNISNTLPQSQLGTLSLVITNLNDAQKTSITPPISSSEGPGSHTSPNWPSGITSLSVTFSKAEVHMANSTRYMNTTGTVNSGKPNGLMNHMYGLTVSPQPTIITQGAPSISPLPNPQNGIWETLNINAPRTVDLIELSKGNFAFFGVTNIAVGTYTEVRLYISSASAVLANGTSIVLDMPGKDNIIRIVNPFTIDAGAATTLTIDFDVLHSLQPTGNGFIFKPVISQFIESHGIPITPGPSPVVSIITPSILPKPTCLPRPACLDAVPRCLIVEPYGGWCAPTPTPMRCGGFIQNPPVCPTGYSCDHTGINPDLPGKCIIVSPTQQIPPLPTVACLPKPSCLAANPPTCELPEPIGGWCPTPTGGQLTGNQLNSVMTYLNNILRALLKTR